MTNSSFGLSQKNLLTINWQTDSPIEFCSFVFLKIELTIRNCNTSDCTKNFDRVPIANLTFTFPEVLEACSDYEYEIYESQFDSKITKQLTSKPQYQNFHVEVEEQENHDGLRVFWSYTQHPLCPRKFLIEVYRNESMIESLVVGDKLSEMINNLEPCGKYFISVNPMHDSDILSNYGSNITYKMSPNIPSGNLIKLFLLTLFETRRFFFSFFKQQE